MSYILDALKKSDQERRQGDVPGLQTVHMPVSVESESARWPYVVIALLMLSLAFVLGMLRPWEAQTTASTVLQADKQNESDASPSTRSVAEMPRAIVEKQPLLIVENQPQLKQAERQNKAPVVVKQNIEIEAPSLDIDSVPHLYDMSSLVQQAIPEMTFAAHVFSSDVEQRSVIINGHAMGEGEVVIDGLKIEQITQKGIVFNYNGQLFRMDILQDWSFD